MPFRAYKAHVAVPKRQWKDKETLKVIIQTAYPNMEVDFVENTRLALLGVEAPDPSSAAIVVPLLEKLLEEHNRESSA